MDIVEKLQQKDKLYFNEEQMKILDHRIGPAAIESTAGSGKTTKLQYELLKLLVNKFENLVILGDSDQSSIALGEAIKIYLLIFIKTFQVLKDLTWELIIVALEILLK